MTARATAGRWSASSCSSWGCRGAPDRTRRSSARQVGIGRRPGPAVWPQCCRRRRSRRQPGEGFPPDRRGRSAGAPSDGRTGTRAGGLLHPGWRPLAAEHPRHHVVFDRDAGRAQQHLNHRDGGAGHYHNQAQHHDLARTDPGPPAGQLAQRIAFAPEPGVWWPIRSGRRSGPTVQLGEPAAHPPAATGGPEGQAVPQRTLTHPDPLRPPTRSDRSGSRRNRWCSR